MKMMKYYQEEENKGEDEALTRQQDDNEIEHYIRNSNNVSLMLE